MTKNPGGGLFRSSPVHRCFSDKFHKRFERVLTITRHHESQAMYSRLDCLEDHNVSDSSKIIKHVVSTRSNVIVLC